LEPFDAIQNRSYERATKSLLDSYPKSKSMNRNKLTDFLESKRYAVLATSRIDGRAHATPISFIVANNAFWIASVEGTRSRNLEAKPWASIVIFEGDKTEIHKAVIAEGPVKLHKTLDKNILEQYKKKVHGNLGWASVFIELKPERLFSFDGSKKQ
jgi:nitroimidazol reductase NimA-like FMN-containing flavoprotein (pyridoxamine 5'-phosphate oxidase superfamily)